MNMSSPASAIFHIRPSYFVSNIVSREKTIHLNPDIIHSWLPIRKSVCYNTILELFF